MLTIVLQTSRSTRVPTVGNTTQQVATCRATARPTAAWTRPTPNSATSATRSAPTSAPHCSSLAHAASCNRKHLDLDVNARAADVRQHARLVHAHPDPQPQPQVRVLREGVLPAVAPARPPSLPHRGQALLLQRLQEKLRRSLKPASSHANSLSR